ncbi:MAG: hypothetical protein KJ950_16970 [Proteobacteria bacterium]|nr:hypothetical protein [Pseudomonadota bacterium]MBU1688175.1 hypothetical protein [Pseudomonadota bacterium]
MQLSLSSRTLKLLTEFDQFKGRWESLGQLVPARLSSLRRITAMESAAAAARMAGYPCSDRQAGEFLAGRQTSQEKALGVEAREAISNAHAVVNLVNTSYDRISLSESHTRQLHSLLIGTGGQATPPTPFQINSIGLLLREATDAIDNAGVHPILVMAVLSRNLWALKPFPVGNKRLNWLLIRLTLLRHNYAFVPFCSLEADFEKKLTDFTRVVREGDGSRCYLTEIDQDWLELFLEALTDMREGLIRKISREKTMLKLPPAHREIIRAVQESGNATISGIATATSTNRNTVKIRLRKMVQSRLLVQNGHGKSTYYSLPELHLK